MGGNIGKSKRNKQRETGIKRREGVNRIDSEIETE